ncbi:MAG: hypothetical protein IJ186_00215 [Bacilli bacterium]|nr:hypothetical protein [Bacilli bacterium]
MTSETAKKVIDIYPSKPTKRVLVTLADIMLTFIASVFIFEVAAKPILQATPFYKENGAIHTESERGRTQVLYDNSLLFYDDVEKEKYNFTANLDRTAKKFIRYYSFGQEDSTYESIHHYFVDIKGENVEKVNELYLKYGKNFFDETKTTPLGTYELKEEYIKFFKPNFEKGNEMSEDGKRHFENFQQNVYLSLYREIMIDISGENDLKSPLNPALLSYNEYTKRVLETEQNVQSSYVLISYLSFTLVIILEFFVLPFTNHKGQTLSERIAKVEHVDKNNLEYLPLRYRLILSIFNVVHASSVVFAIPILTYGFTNLFSLPMLYTVSFVGILVLIAELVFVLSTNLNQSLKEIGTNSIVVDSSLMDLYYKEKGYGR